jgi:hypothetical protein
MIAISEKTNDVFFNHPLKKKDAESESNAGMPSAAPICMQDPPVLLQS